jgi:diguanylate cyclase (GGDEF)-like protein
MATGLNSLGFNGCPGKPKVVGISTDDLSDVALLNITVDPQSLFRRRASRVSQSGDSSAIDDVFRGLLAKANRELASLLRDVRTDPQGIVLGEARSRQVSELLMRAVRCAAKQYMLQAELGNLALTDELTGLYNRRGFMAMAERQMRLGRRNGRGMLLFMIDVDGLKNINDSFGHLEGDRALKCTSAILEETFRDSDVVARLGGDEFAVLAIEAAGHSEPTIKTRLFECLKSTKAEQSRCEVSLSLGVARFDPRDRTSIGELMARADQSMYEQKRRRSSRPALETELSSQPEAALWTLSNHHR